jgi:hypothetical protein
VEDGCILFIGNSTIVAVKGKGTMNLEFTSGNVLTLTDVYYVPEIRKNLMSGGLLNKEALSKEKAEEENEFPEPEPGS